MPSEYFYLAVNICTILFPLLFSFEKKVAFYRWRKCLLPAIFLTAVPLIIFDDICTAAGIWYFNENYVTGIKVFHLPVEEVLFFFTIPYACLYMYVALHAVFKSSRFFERYKNIISGAAILACSFLSIVYPHCSYTFMISATAAVILLLTAFFRVKFMGNFWRFFLIQLIPFTIVNGILTGSMLGKEVFLYDQDSITGLRLFTIPVEDILFSLVMLLMNISFLEICKNRQGDQAFKKVATV